MYAIVEILGQQFKVEAGRRVYVHRMETAERGSQIELDKVLLIDNEGNITNIAVTDCSAETPGIGDKIVKEAWFMEQFLGLNGEAKKGENVDAISGTTISSGAFFPSQNVVCV